MESRPLLTIGAGNMASAILDGALRAGVIAPDSLGVFDLDLLKAERFPHGFDSMKDAAAWLSRAESESNVRGIILLAVKPQGLEGVRRSMDDADFDPSDRTLVSVLAGSSIATIARVLSDQLNIVRVMPNTPASVGLGMSAICAAPGVPDEDTRAVETLFAAVGETVKIEERLIDAFTAVAGSGPAYLFLLAEAMHAAAVRLGFDRDDAERIVTQTVLGASTLLRASEDSASSLRHRVTSPGGTTAAAIDTFERGGFTELVISALRAARDRGAELNA